MARCCVRTRFVIRALIAGTYTVRFMEIARSANVQFVWETLGGICILKSTVLGLDEGYLPVSPVESRVLLSSYDFRSHGSAVNYFCRRTMINRATTVQRREPYHRILQDETQTTLFTGFRQTVNRSVGL